MNDIREKSNSHLASLIEICLRLALVWQGSLRSYSPTTHRNGKSEERESPARQHQPGRANEHKRKTAEDTLKTELKTRC